MKKILLISVLLTSAIFAECRKSNELEVNPITNFMGNIAKATGGIKDKALLVLAVSHDGKIAITNTKVPNLKVCERIGKRFEIKIKGSTYACESLLEENKISRETF